MSEHTITCTSGVSDTLTAQSSIGNDVAFYSRQGGVSKISVYAAPSDARTFARGILALCDEADGGEVKEDPAATVEGPTVRGIKVGDKVRVLVDDAEYARVSRGDILCVTHVGGNLIVADEANTEGEGWYFRNAKSLEKVVDEPEPLVEWERDLLTPPAVVRPQIGDRVRVIQGDPHASGDDFAGRVGKLIADDGAHDRIPFLVRFGPGEHGDVDGQWYCAKVEIVDESTPEAPPAEALTFTTRAAIDRETFVARAKSLLAGTDHTGADVIAMAAFLAGGGA
ncbi:hypothetical protein [Streptomyces fulvorobeus]|uniref:Uncharacterized protein n=1 Tax=Streptomyces fulvorobeus TaxID=284028 RepID=A0A7J0CGC0_9ACTN|nr:hypothetical protein [Streptomyces fulvorobeus]NYE44251.1 hypothetical protein [Streptomyces fulvorobeus]GFN00767.1 hypothetical protein Sfulv_55770 [Streptomyces fulvorobeus]